MPTPPHRPSKPANSPGSQPRPANLLALGSAAVLTVYATGFLRTNAAAQALAEGSDARRRPIPSSPAQPMSAASPVAPIAPPSDDSVRYAVALKDGVAQVVSSGRDSAAALPTAKPSSGPGEPSATTSKAAEEPVGAGGATVAAAAPSAVSSPAFAAAVTTPAASAPAAPAPEVVAATPAPATASSSTVPSTPSSPAPATPAAAPAPKAVGWHDGTFTGWGTSRHGDIEATVVIEGGKITGAIISRCLTRYSCSWVAHLQQQVVVRQSPEVDNVSGATQSANAFFYAVSEALGKAK